MGIMSRKKVVTSANGQFRCGYWKINRSSHHQDAYPNTLINVAKHAHTFSNHIPKKVARPARDQKPPVRLIYKIPSLALYVVNTDLKTKDSKRRSPFQSARPRMKKASKVNTIDLRCFAIFTHRQGDIVNVDNSEPTPSDPLESTKRFPSKIRTFQR